ncbi:hypothetical protein [Natroniella sp. ANB-PHB2]|uniref:hypothetical protein n=1 Tax=Natroniella sp. ANB-PHB2 TaxID=3384444 RepID=UPI0038D3D78E
MKKTNLTLIIILSIYLVFSSTIEIKAEDINLNHLFDSVGTNDTEESSEKTTESNTEMLSSKEESLNYYFLGFGFFGNVKYTTYDTTMSLYGVEWAEHNEALQSGVGFSGGIIYKFNEGLGIKGGLGYEVAQDEGLKVDLIAPYSEIEINVLDNLFDLNFGIGKYGYRFYEERTDFLNRRRRQTYQTGSGIGYKIGAVINLFENKKDYWKLRAGYRFLDVDIERHYGEYVQGLEVDMSGWKSSFELGRKF